MSYTTDKEDIHTDCKKRSIIEESRSSLSVDSSTPVPDEETSLFEDGSPAEVESRLRGGRLSCICRYLKMHSGLYLVLVSCVFNGFSSIGVKMLAGGIPPTEVASFRLLFYFICSSFLLVYNRIPVRVNRRQAFWIVIRSLAGSGGMTCSFYGYQNIPVGDTTAILFSSPIFTGILAWILLGEKFTLFDASLSVLTLAGITLIARPTFLFGDLGGTAPEGGNVVLGTVAALAGTVFVSLVYVSIRKLGGISVHPLVQIWLFGIGGLAVTCMLTSVIGVWAMPRCGRERLVVIVASLCGILSQIAMTYAFLLEKSTSVALMKSNNVIVAFILEFLFFGTVPHWLSIVGSSLVMTCCIALTLEKWRSAVRQAKRKEEEHQANNADGSHVGSVIDINENNFTDGTSIKKK